MKDDNSPNNNNKIHYLFKHSQVKKMLLISMTEIRIKSSKNGKVLYRISI